MAPAIFRASVIPSPRGRNTSIWTSPEYSLVPPAAKAKGCVGSGMSLMRTHFRSAGGLNSLLGQAIGRSGSNRTPARRANSASAMMVSTAVVISRGFSYRRQMLLSDNQVHDALCAAVEALGNQPAETVRGETALAAAR